MKTEWTRDELLRSLHGKALCVLCCGHGTHTADCPLADPEVILVELVGVTRRVAAEADAILVETNRCGYCGLPVRELATCDGPPICYCSLLDRRTS